MVREMDVVGDYALGCYALMLPSAGLSEAIRVAERLQGRFILTGEPAAAEHPRPTLSIGVVQIMEGDDWISVLTRAEIALDAADRRGGNRACFHDGERCVPITAMLEAPDKVFAGQGSIPFYGDR